MAPENGAGCLTSVCDSRCVGGFKPCRGIPRASRGCWILVTSHHTAATVTLSIRQYKKRAAAGCWHAPLRSRTKKGEDEYMVQWLLGTHTATGDERTGPPAGHKSKRISPLARSLGVLEEGKRIHAARGLVHRARRRQKKRHGMEHSILQRTTGFIFEIEVMHNKSPASARR